MNYIKNLLFSPENKPRDLDIVSHMKKDKDQIYSVLSTIAKEFKSGAWSSDEIVFKSKLSSEQLVTIENKTEEEGLYLGRVIVILAALDQYIADILECDFQSYFCKGSNVKSTLIRTMIYDQESQEQVHQSVYGLIHHTYFGLTDLIPFARKITSDNFSSYKPYEDYPAVRQEILDECTTDAKIFLNDLSRKLSNLTNPQKMMISSGLEGTLLMLSFLAIHVTKLMDQNSDIYESYNLSDFLTVLYNANKFITIDEINHTNLSCLLIKEYTYSLSDEMIVIPILDDINYSFIDCVTHSHMTDKFIEFYEKFRTIWLGRIRGTITISTQDIVKNTDLSNIIEVSYDNFFANMPIYKKNSSIDYSLTIDTSNI
jgi:hypothetical protein